MPGKRRRTKQEVLPNLAATPPEASRPPINVLFVDPDIATARQWGRILREHDISVTTADHIRGVRSHISRNADTLDAIVFGLLVPGGEPSDILAAVTSAGSACGLVLASHESRLVVTSAAARLRADVALCAPVGEQQMIAAILRAKSCADLRRAPALRDHRDLPSTDRGELTLEIVCGVLYRAGLRHPHRREAIGMRMGGMTDEGAAQQCRITPGRFRARAGDALHELGIEDAYGLPVVVATQLFDDLHALAATHGPSALALVAQLERALVAHP